MAVADIERLAAERGWPDDDLRYAREKLGRKCRTCGAEPGELCRTRSGRVITGLDYQHRNR